MPRIPIRLDDVLLQKVVIFAGHGVWSTHIIKDGIRSTIPVPSNTTITFWTPDNSTLDNDLGQQVDLARGLSLLWNRIHNGSGGVLPITYGPGEQVNNYWLLPPGTLELNNRRSHNFVTVDAPTTLEVLLYRYTGNNCHWAAYREQQKFRLCALTGQFRYAPVFR